ncbi:MAG: hypothetical protein QM760_19280 [Nibricoccus sp.]
MATGPASEYVGKTAAYDVIVTNVGDAAARNAYLTAAADAGAVVGIADANAAGDRLSLGTIEPGGKRKVRVTAKPTIGGGAMTVRATAKSDCADAVTATHRTAVQVIAATGMEVVNRDDPARVGEPIRLQMTVQNTGSGPDRNVKVVATLPPQLTYGSANSPTQGRAAGQQVIFEPLKELGPGQTATWTVEARPRRPATRGSGRAESETPDRAGRADAADEGVLRCTGAGIERGDVCRRTDILVCHSEPTPGFRRRGPRPGRRSGGGWWGRHSCLSLGLAGTSQT